MLLTLTITGLSLTALWSSWSPSGPDEARAQDGAGPLACYQAAREESLLNEEESIRLCCGLNSTAPVECYLGVSDQTTLDSGRSIDLCQCAVNTQPAECFIQSQTETSLDRDRAIELCKQTLTPVLPIPAVPPVRGALPQERALEGVEDQLAIQTEMTEQERQANEEQLLQQDQARSIENELDLLDQQQEILEQKLDLLESQRALLEQKSQLESGAVTVPEASSVPLTPQPPESAAPAPEPELSP